MAAAQRLNKTPVVIVNADPFATHQTVINVLEAARVAGYDKLTFAAQRARRNNMSVSARIEPDIGTSLDPPGEPLAFSILPLESTLTRAWLRRGPLAGAVAAVSAVPAAGCAAARPVCRRAG